MNDIWKDKTNVALIHMEKFFSNTEFNASLCNIYYFQRIMQMRWPVDRCLFYCIFVMMACKADNAGDWAAGAIPQLFLQFQTVPK